MLQGSHPHATCVSHQRHARHPTGGTIHRTAHPPNAPVLSGSEGPRREAPDRVAPPAGSWAGTNSCERTGWGAGQAGLGCGPRVLSKLWPHRDPRRRTHSREHPHVSRHPQRQASVDGTLSLTRGWKTVQNKTWSEQRAGGSPHHTVDTWEHRDTRQERTPGARERSSKGLSRASAD